MKFSNNTISKIIALKLALVAPSLIYADEVILHGNVDGILSYSDSAANHNGVSNSLSPIPLSTIRLNAQTSVTDDIKATGQIIAQRDVFDGNMQGVFDLGYLSYELPYGVEMDAGLIRMNTGMYSEYAYQGIETHWLILPESIYTSQLPNRLYGMSFSGHRQWKDINLDATFYAGESEKKVKLGAPISILTELNFQNIFGSTVSAYNSEASIFLSYVRTDVRVESEELLLLTAYGNLTEELSQLPINILPTNSGRVLTLGGTYEIDNSTLFVGEIIEQKLIDELNISLIGYYLGLTQKVRNYELGVAVSGEHKTDSGNERIQNQLILSGAYHINPKLKVASQYTFTDSASETNPNFANKLKSTSINELAIGIQYQF